MEDELVKSEKSLQSSIIVVVSLLLGLAILLIASVAHAETDEQIVRAIYKAEGGAKATYLYGIRSVKYGSAQEAYRICLNTVRNNRRRWEREGAKGDYLTYLSKKYCPVGCENDRGTNRYWLKNVRFFLAKEVSHE